jgi:hypothetical protein
VYVGYGSGGIAVIDPVTLRKTADLPLKGHPESFQVENAGASANFPMGTQETLFLGAKQVASMNKKIRLWKHSADTL